MQQSPNSPRITPRKSRLQGCLPSYKTVAKIEGGLVAVVTVACLITGWSFPTTLIWAGMAAIAFGGMSLVGGVSITRNFAYQQAQSAGPLTIQERAKQELSERGGQFEFLMLMFFIGVLTVSLGFVASMLGL